MRIINVEQLKKVLGELRDPTVLGGAVDEVVPGYRLHMLNAQMRCLTAKVAW